MAGRGRSVGVGTGERSEDRRRERNSFVLGEKRVAARVFGVCVTRPRRRRNSSIYQKRRRKPRQTYRFRPLRSRLWLNR